MSGDAVYLRIADNFDRHAAGAPRSGENFSRAFIVYLKILYPPQASEVVQHLKVTGEFYASGYTVSDYTSAGRLAELSGKRVEVVKGLLDPLVKKSALIGNAEAQEEADWIRGALGPGPETGARWNGLSVV